MCGHVFISHWELTVVVMIATCDSFNLGHIWLAVINTQAFMWKIVLSLRFNLDVVTDYKSHVTAHMDNYTRKHGLRERESEKEIDFPAVFFFSFVSCLAGVAQLNMERQREQERDKYRHKRRESTLLYAVSTEILKDLLLPL